MKGKKGNEVKKITLDDCLSCTGCITSSDALLVNNCSLENHFSLIKNNYKDDDSFKIGIISYQALESFLIVYKQTKKIQNHSINYYNEIANIIAEILNMDFILPLNDFILYTLNLSFNYMSNIKSPHEIASIIINAGFEKYFNNINNNYNSDKNLYLCSIMSCFDKKIEPIKYKTGINTVISSIELEEKFKTFLMNEYNTKNKIISIQILDKSLDILKNIKETKELINEEIIKNKMKINLSLYNFSFIENYSSNFYIEYFIYKIKKLYPKCYIERKPGKNIDSKEIIIYNDETKNEIQYKFLISYGFRNIHNIVKNIKSSKNKYDYIELMACPGGCINGAGQIRVEKSRDDIFNQIKNGFDYFKEEEKTDIDISINEIEKIVCKLNIDKILFKQSFKEADFSKSDMDW